MKNLLFSLGLFMVFGSVYSCEILGEEDEDSLIELPANIQEYIAANYPDFEVDESEKETLCTGAEVYEVELEANDDDEIELVFDLEGSLLYEVVEIETAQLPEAVVSSINAEYVEYKIEEASRWDLSTDGVQYEVELEQNDTELEVLFSGNGTVICEEVSDDD